MISNINLQKYLWDNISDDIEMEKIDISRIPIYLKDAYDYYGVNISSCDCNLCISKSNRVVINQLIKHTHVLNKLGLNNIVFVFENLRAEQRRRLIGH